MLTERQAEATLALIAELYEKLDSERTTSKMWFVAMKEAQAELEKLKAEKEAQHEDHE